MEREACVCDHGFERSDLCAEMIIIIIYTFLSPAWRSLTAVFIVDAREARFEGITVCAL